VATPQITPEEARYHPSANVIYRLSVIKLRSRWMYLSVSYPLEIIFVVSDPIERLWLATMRFEHRPSILLHLRRPARRWINAAQMPPARGYVTASLLI